jgi:hypothetical protein
VVQDYGHCPIIGDREVFYMVFGFRSGKMKY